LDGGGYADRTERERGLGVNVEIRPIKGIGLAKYNPRKISDQALDSLVQSIERFGFVDPVIVNDRTGILVGGHQRLKAAKKLGLKDVPVVAVNLDEAEEKALNVALNKISGEWDLELLRGVLEDVQASGLDLSLTGFTEDEWQAMGGTPSPVQGLTDPEEVPELPEEAEAITKPGDLWILGEHRLLCGDSTKAEDVALVMDGAKADMLLTDPPYGVSYVGKTKDALKVENDELGEKDLTALVVAAFDNAEANCRAGAYWYATVPAGPLHILFADDWKRRGILRQIMVWAKDSMVLGHSEYHYQHEPILFGWMPGDRHKNSDRTRTTLWKYDRPKANREHPTMKPVALWSQAVNDGSRVGEVVYDPFLGSGTTLIAAEQLGRKCYGLEISPKYCDVIVKRWEQFTGKKAHRAETSA
jgi:DNA modification methylase